MKNSTQRNLVLDIVNNSCNHPTADMVYNSAKETLPNISLATVYRNLNLLAELGSIKKIAVYNGQDRFDKTLTPHHHFVCDKCGNTYDITLSNKADLVSIIEKETGHQIITNNLVFKGICKYCKEEN